MDFGSMFKNAMAASIADFALDKLLAAVVVAVIALALIKIVMKAVDKGLGKSRLDNTVKKLLRGAIKIVLLFIAVLMIMGRLGIPVTSLVALLSVAGLAVSLAVQNFLANVAGGLQMLASRPFKEGDFVEAAGCTGTIKEIGLFYTKILTLDNKLVSTPNSAIMGGVITNYSAEPIRRVDLLFSASYDCPVETVKAVILRVMQDHGKVLSDPEPFVRVSNYGASAIDYTVRAWCANADYWDVYFDLMEQVKAAFDANGIIMTYDHVNVHIVEK